MTDLTIESQAFILLWLLFFGSAVGSFMNVVVYRLPAGLSIIHPGSHCPSCGHAIRAYDNVPVLSWLMLRGRCRDCRARISIRYPIVEGLAATLFVVLAVVELLSGGRNLPTHETLFPRLPLSPSSLVLLYAVHLFTLCTLLSAALIQADGKRVPLSLFAPGLIVAFAAPLVWPELRPLPLTPGSTPVHWQAGLAEGLGGLSIGALLGWLTFPATNRSAGGRWPAAAAGALCGVTLGWQAAATLTSCTAVVFLVTEMARVIFARYDGARTARTASPWFGYLITATLLYIAFWSRLAGQSLVDRWFLHTWNWLVARVLLPDRQMPPPSFGSWPLTLLAAAGFVFTCSLLTLVVSHMCRNVTDG